MIVVHRLVITIAFFGALVGWFFFPPNVAHYPMMYFGMAVPGVLAAVLIYPLAWIASGFRRH